MTDPVVIGLDPGASSGGIAVVERTGDLLSIAKWGATDHDMVAQIGEYMPRCIAIVIEKVHAMPKQGVSSTFKFGRHAGLLMGAALSTGKRVIYVRPQQWQKRLGCMTKGDKNVSKEAAQLRYPLAHITHATADAILLACYGWHVLRTEGWGSFGKQP